MFRSIKIQTFPGATPSTLVIWKYPKAFSLVTCLLLKNYQSAIDMPFLELGYEDFN